MNWRGIALPDDGKPRAQDAYDVDVDPYDSAHLILGYHEQTGVSESTDGGDSWRAVKLPSGMTSGVSLYVFFIDTGEPGTNRGRRGSPSHRPRAGTRARGAPLTAV